MAVEETTPIEPTEPVVAPVEPVVEQVQSGQIDGGVEASEQPGKDVTSQEAGGGTEAASSSVWLTDDLKALGNSSGFSDEELVEFQSAAELNRAVRAIDKRFAAYGEAAARAAAPQQQTQQTQQQSTQQAAPQTTAKLPRVDIEKLKAANWDEETLAEFAKQNQVIDRLEQLESDRQREQAEHSQIKSQFQNWQQYIAYQQQQQDLYEFHAAVDGLGDKRFGNLFDKDGRQLQLTNEQHELRKRVWDSGQMIETGMRSQTPPGQPPPTLPKQIAVRRAYNFAFADDIRKEERLRVQNELAAQAKLRRPAANRNPAGQYSAVEKVNPFNTNEYVQAVANSPDLVAKFAQYQQENGQTV